MSEKFTDHLSLGFGAGHNSEGLYKRHITESCNAYTAIVDFYKLIVDNDGWSNKYPNMKTARKMMHSDLVELGILEERQTRKGGREVKQWRLIRPFRGDYKKLILQQVEKNYSV